jgi:hypothetical protein
LDHPASRRAIVASSPAKLSPAEFRTTMKPRILLATPTHDGKAYCLEFWVRRVRAIQRATPCDVLVADNSLGEGYARQMRKLGLKVLRTPAYDEPLRSLAESRRKLYAQALRHGYDYFFSLEQDLFPPPDIIRHLLELRREIAAPHAVVAAPYLIKYLSGLTPPYHTVDQLTSVARGLTRSERTQQPMQQLVPGRELLKAPGVEKVFAAGLGCALFDTALLQRIEVRWSQATYEPDDAFFYLDLQQLGIPVHVDTRLLDKVIHISGNVHTVYGWWSMASSVKHRRPKPRS